jgi:hypothetical protein
LAELREYAAEVTGESALVPSPQGQTTVPEPEATPEA